jgi:uncharacterized membrane protein
MSFSLSIRTVLIALIALALALAAALAASAAYTMSNHASSTSIAGSWAGTA